MGSARKGRPHTGPVEARRVESIEWSAGSRALPVLKLAHRFALYQPQSVVELYLSADEDHAQGFVAHRERVGRTLEALPEGSQLNSENVPSNIHMAPLNRGLYPDHISVRDILFSAICSL